MCVDGGDVTPAFAHPLHVGRPNVGPRAAFDSHVDAMFERNWLTNSGPLVEQFEDELAQRLQVGHVVAMCNGTIALEIAIRALGLGGEVIVPAFTFVATAHSLYWQDITPVFADIDPDTHNLDPDAVEQMITPRTTGVIGVHLWGRPAPIEALTDLCERRGLTLMFDAAHAFGCTHGGTPIARFGRAEVFSFHATKAFNTFEGGAVATDDPDLAETMRLMRNFGFSGYDNVIHPGTNGKMIEVCAAMGLVNLGCLPETFEVNRRNHAAYTAGLAGLPGVDVLAYDEREQNNYHYVVALIDNSRAGVSRDEVISHLHRHNVLARRYFWPGVHRMKPYRDLFPHAGLLLPHTETVARQVVVLPTGRSVDESDIAVICELIRSQVRG